MADLALPQESPQEPLPASDSARESLENAQGEHVSISVDVVCPGRLVQEGFAVAPLAIRVPAVAVSSLASLFAAFKVSGSLADETDVRGTSESV